MDNAQTTVGTGNLRNGSEFRTALDRRGYCVIKNILDDAMIQKLHARFSDASLSKTSGSNFSTSGALIRPDYSDALTTELLTWPATLQLLSQMGFADPRLHSYYITTKPPGSEALAWHSDLFYEYDATEPAELFLLYYIQDTSPANGCLRVVPGSHRWPQKLLHAQPEDTALRDDETDVAVKAGSLFIGDRRILHATHENVSPAWRTGITIALAPDYGRLPEPVQALIVQNGCLPPAGWWNDAEQQENIPAALQNILPIYTGSAKPAPLIED